MGAARNLPTPNAPTHPNAPNQHAPTNSPKKIHPSPLPGGRLGGGWDAASVYRRVSGRHALSVIPAQAGTASRHLRSPFRHSCVPPLVIPAQAGTASPLPPPLRRQEPTRHPCAPLPSFLRRQEPRPPSPPPFPLPSFPRPPSVIPPPPLRHSCAGRNRVPPSVIPASPLRHSCAGRNRAPHPPFLPTQE